MGNSSLINNVSAGLTKKIKSFFNNPYKKVNLNWAKLKYYKHLPNGKIRSHKLFGKPIYFNSATELVYAFDEIFLDEIYKQNLPDKPYVIDCGANIGLSVIYLKQLNPDAKIIAFEPDEKNFELLAKNIRSFDYQDVVLKKEAVWIEDTVLKFISEGSMSSKIELNKDAAGINVKATRLYNLLDTTIDFLKIDIEGAEFAVVNDIADRLYMVKNMFIEYHGSFNQNHELSALIQLISNAGFHFYIKEAMSIYNSPFEKAKDPRVPYDLQLNIFCFR